MSRSCHKPHIAAVQLVVATDEVIHLIALTSLVSSHH